MTASAAWCGGPIHTKPRTLSYAYDAVGNQIHVSGSDGVDHRYSFDANNRVTQVLQGRRP